MSKLDTLLEKWFLLKQDILKQQKLEEKIRTKIKDNMKTKDLKTINTEKYKVSLSTMARETLSKKDCPRDLWSRYSKTSKFDILKLTKIKDENNSENEEEIDL